MKKCPYCAEGIQEETVKCKHCGEWLSASSQQSGVKASTISQEFEASPTGEESEALPRKDVGDTKFQAIAHVTTLGNEPRKYGWGWFLLLGMIGVYTVKMEGQLSDYRLSLVWGILPLFFLIPYFGIRKKLLAKLKFPSSKDLTPGFAAGVITYLLAIIVLPGLVVIDKRALYSRINTVATKYIDRGLLIKQQEEKYLSELINEPQTARDMRNNLQVISQIREQNKEKEKFAHEMLADFKQALKNKNKAKAKTSWEKRITQLESLFDKAAEKTNESWALLGQYYTTGNEDVYRKYTETYQKAERLTNEYQSKLGDTFGPAANK